MIRGIVAAREEGGAFRDLEDFIERMNNYELNKRAVENFIKCGSMDCFGHHRSELLAVYDTMMDSIAASHKKNLDGQMGMFAMFDDTKRSGGIEIPTLPELRKADLMLMERETTGIYLSGHPMDDYRHLLKGTRVIPIAQLMDNDNGFKDDQIVSIAGVVHSVKMKTTRNNSMMAYVTLEDDTAAIEILVFSKGISEFGGYLGENQAVVVTGRLSLRDDKDPQIVANSARPMKDYTQPVKMPLVVTDETVLYLKLPTEDEKLFPKVKAILNMFPGRNQAVLYFADTKQRRGTKCMITETLVAELKSLLGDENVVPK